jgi:hypothetical protein
MLDLRNSVPIVVVVLLAFLWSLTLAGHAEEALAYFLFSVLFVSVIANISYYRMCNEYERCASEQDEMTAQVAIPESNKWLLLPLSLAAFLVSVEAMASQQISSYHLITETVLLALIAIVYWRCLLLLRRQQGIASAVSPPSEPYSPKYREDTPAESIKDNILMKDKFDTPFLIVTILVTILAIVCTIYRFSMLVLRH